MTIEQLTNNRMQEIFVKTTIETLFKGPFSTGYNIQLLWKDQESFRTIFDAVRQAREFICLQFYIFRNDETGLELAAILKQKSKEGVKVYLLYDNFGSLETPRTFWNEMKLAGIKIRTSRPFAWKAPFRYLHRDHRKLIVIDAQRAFTGGLNIANEYSGFHLRRRGTGWRDTGILIEGPLVKDLLKSFTKSWYAWGGEEIEFQQNEPFQNANCLTYLSSDACAIPVIPLFVDSAKKRRRMRKLLYFSINHAQRTISLTTAYFTPSRRMLETLEGAVRRGVKVRLLIPAESDVPAAWYAGRAFFSRLLRAGVEIHQYLGQILHAKTYVFDENWSIIGSTNLDFQSLRYNDEGNVGILDEDFALKMTEIFEEDLRHSLKIDTAAWHKRPFAEKMKEHFFALFRRRL